jgi:hypothetical protein
MSPANQELVVFFCLGLIAASCILFSLWSVSS